MNARLKNKNKSGSHGWWAYFEHEDQVYRVPKAGSASSHDALLKGWIKQKSNLRIGIKNVADEEREIELQICARAPDACWGTVVRKPVALPASRRKLTHSMAGLTGTKPEPPKPQKKVVDTRKVKRRARTGCCGGGRII